MNIRPGYLYHIKDEFFKVVGNDVGLMTNHENGGARPSYFVIEDNELLWFIPLSTKYDKYKNIYDKKMAKYGTCDNFILTEIHGEKMVILIQNAFPTLRKYIDHEHTINGKPYKIPTSLTDVIINKFNSLMLLKKRGKNLFFTDIDKIKEIMEDELVHNCKCQEFLLFYDKK